MQSLELLLHFWPLVTGFTVVAFFCLKWLYAVKNGTISLKHKLDLHAGLMAAHVTQDEMQFSDIKARLKRIEGFVDHSMDA